MNDAGVLHLTLALTRKVPEPVALPSRYVLLGHRGYARNAPENTIQACLDALDAVRPVWKSIYGVRWTVRQWSFTTQTFFGWPVLPKRCRRFL